MKGSIEQIVRDAFAECRADGTLASSEEPSFVIERPAQPEHGDFATNLAMLLAKAEKKAPRAIAEMLVAKLRLRSELIERVDIAGPGFINFFIARAAWQQALLSSGFRDNSSFRNFK